MPVSESQKRARDKWDKNHPEKIKACKKKYNQTHKEEWNAYHREYRRKTKALKIGFLELANIECF